MNYIGATQTELSYNAFAYCENEPVNNSDANGFWGADIHYGRKYTNKEYANKNNQWLEIIKCRFEVQGTQNSNNNIFDEFLSFN